MFKLQFTLLMICKPSLLGHLTAKSDVYGYGVVLLELLTGRRAVDKTRPTREQNLVEWARPGLNNAQKLARLMDPSLDGQYSTKAAQKAAAVAYQCLSHNPKSRPLMSGVVETLEPLLGFDDIPPGPFVYTAPLMDDKENEKGNENSKRNENENINKSESVSVNGRGNENADENRTGSTSRNKDGNESGRRDQNGSGKINNKGSMNGNSSENGSQNGNEKENGSGSQDDNASKKENEIDDEKGSNNTNGNTSMKGNDNENKNSPENENGEGIENQNDRGKENDDSNENENEKQKGNGSGYRHKAKYKFSHKEMGKWIFKTHRKVEKNEHDSV